MAYKENCNEDSLFRWWYDDSINDLETKWRENGAWDELGFDIEAEIEVEWALYLKKHTTR